MRAPALLFWCSYAAAVATYGQGCSDAGSESARASDMTTPMSAAGAVATSGAGDAGASAADGGAGRAAAGASLPAAGGTGAISGMGGAAAVAGQLAASGQAATGVAGATAGSAASDAGRPAADGGKQAGSGGAPAGGAGTGGTAAVSGNITIWIAGDSTVANGETPCPVGWGADFQKLFKASAKVVNSAVGGRSVRTWLYDVTTSMGSDGECVLNKDASGMPTLQARWQQMLDGMHDGDYLMIQFGINDSSATCDRHVGIDAFKASYAMMADAAKQRGAQPIFLTPVSAIACQGSTAKPTRGEYVTATIDAGNQHEVPVIDLHQRSIDLYNQMGFCPLPGGSDVSASTTGKVGDFFCGDHTHFERAGSDQIGKLVADALRDQKLGLAAYLN